MTTHYLIGKGELLTQPIPAPHTKPGPKLRPYTLAEAQRVLVPQIATANSLFANLPSEACPEDLVVARMALHPAFLAKTYFPNALLEQAGLASVGSRTVRVHPRRMIRRQPHGSEGTPGVETTEIYVAGQRTAMRRFGAFAQALTEDAPTAEQFAEIEAIAAMQAGDRIREAQLDGGRVFEVGLHLMPERPEAVLRGHFKAFAAKCGFQVQDEFAFAAGGLVFLALEGPPEGLAALAQFSLVRVVRSMPKLRGVRPFTRGSSLAIPFTLPSGEPLSREPKVAVLDGGLPADHVLDGFVRRYFKADPDALDVPDYLEHGLGVTSATLFGPLEPDSVAHRPFAKVDHHRVLDAQSDQEDPYELYRTLANIETVLLSRQYQFINLSLGPDMAVEVDDVHAWTAVIDSLLSDGQTLMAVAVGNNGQKDSATGLNRIQIPSDCVNALSVGAADHSTVLWARASYSARGPGRSPGRRKPDLVAFGGSPKEYFHVAAPGLKPNLAATLGTSFAAPYALRSAVGIRAILGDAVHPLTTKALLIHGCEAHALADSREVGWGRMPGDLNDLITCGDGEARIIYQGELRPGKYLRARVPLPPGQLSGKVTLRATFCYASPVDPEDAAAYTKAGLDITFRPHEGHHKPGAAQPDSRPFFPAAEFRDEAELRTDLGKWETVLHAEKTFMGGSLLEPVFDVHYNARDGGGPAPSGAERIRYALVLTVRAPRHPELHEDILKSHAVLEALVPQISIPIRI